MKGKALPLIFIGSLLLVVILLVYFNRNQFNWNETYDINSKEPYGTYVMGELLKNYIPGEKFTVVKEPVNSILKKSGAKHNSTYVFVGESFPYDSALAADLLKYVSD